MICHMLRCADRCCVDILELSLLGFPLEVCAFRNGYTAFVLRTAVHQLLSAAFSGRDAAVIKEYTHDCVI